MSTQAEAFVTVKREVLERIAEYVENGHPSHIADKVRVMTALRAALEQPVVEPIDGDILPPIGSRVFIRHGRDDDAHACTVTGYYAWGDLGGDKHRSRVFVRLVYEGTSVPQARILCDCYPSAEAALNNTAPQPAQQPKHKILTHQEIDDLFPDGCYSLESIRIAECAILKKNGLLP